MWETPPAEGGSQGVRHEGDSTAAAGQVEGYTISQAAALLGVHTNTLRKRIRNGKLKATLVDGPTGQEYRIPAGAVQAVAVLSRAPAGAATRVGQAVSLRSDSTVIDTPLHQVHTEVGIESGMGETPPPPAGDHQSDSTPSTAIQSAARAREMAIYTEELLGPWRRRVEELAVENGRLQERVDQLEHRLAEARAAQEEHAAAELTPVQPRPWWKFW